MRALCRTVLADYLGEEAADALIRAMGGLEIVVPVRPEGERWQRIATAVGPERAHEMVRHFRGEKLYIPLDAVGRREAQREWVIRQRAAGRTIDEIAADAVFLERRTARWVRRVLREAKRLGREPG